MAGIPAPGGLDSRSLLPLLQGRSKDLKNESISQVGGRLMIKQDDLKYILYPNEKSEILFDLAKDPHERKNCVTDSAYHATPRFCSTSLTMVVGDARLKVTGARLQTPCA